MLDGKTLLDGPFDPTGSGTLRRYSAADWNGGIQVAFFPTTKFDPIDDAALKASVKQALRLNADADIDRVIGAYKKGRPGLQNIDYSLVLASDIFRRRGGHRGGAESGAKGARVICITSPGSRPCVKEN